MRTLKLKMKFSIKPKPLDQAKCSFYSIPGLPNSKQVSSQVFAALEFYSKDPALPQRDSHIDSCALLPSRFLPGHDYLQETSLLFFTLQNPAPSTSTILSQSVYLGKTAGTFYISDLAECICKDLGSGPLCPWSIIPQVLTWGADPCRLHFSFRDSFRQ